MTRMTPEKHEQSESGVSGVSPQVEKLGKAFVTSWLIDHDTRIEAYLQDVPEDLRNEAHDMLIRLEVYIRASHGEALESDEYVKRFPDYEVEIEHAFRPESQSASIARSVSSVNQSETAIVGDPAGFQMATRYDVVPERVGRYEIECVLGTGGFGVVCLARDSELDRLVALKFARTSRFRNPQEMKDLIKEARTAAQLEHPGIVAVHDVLAEGDVIAIIQQYIEGRDLAAELKETPPSFERTAELLIGISTAIAFAHSKGFVHRDLKPANVLLNLKGEPHIADFGLAIHESFQRRRRGDQSGTPRFMSPELVRGESHRIDGRSDIWSIGVMMYQMLSGKRPFSGETRAELFDEIKNREPTPPRQIKPEIPVELERICLRCLQKPVSKRFATATDIAVDLRLWMQDVSTSRSEQESGSDRFAEVIPKGLRSFDADDADFFLGLLPGPFSRNGLPESIRFWKGRIEKRDSDQLQIGLLYGPSGCGKSSLVKAGLIPHLSPFVKAVQIDATAADTEIRLIRALRSRYSDIPTELTLPELFLSLREGVWSTGSDRILIIIDQFEQWLHNRSSYPHTELVEALRHCDGERLQCLLMVRDDFWLATSRFLKALEIDLVEGKNAALIDLFDKPHAQKVLRRYGRGYGRLQDEISKSENDFIEMAVDELAEDNRVICVRLSLFAEMFKDKPWTPASLRRAGGISGVGVAFLEDTFSSKTARPEFRLHEQAARKILGALLPETQVDIRGNMRSRHDLLHLSGYANRPNAFSDALRILDNELRLITPTDPEGIGNHQENDPASGKDYYQLTHDYLVPSLRRWLYQKQRETMRGRAQLRLDERFATWSRTRENRFLPSIGEYINVRTMTRPADWSKGERELMRKSDRVYGLGFLVVLSTLLIVGWVGFNSYNEIRADSLAKRVVETETADVPGLITEINESGLRERVAQKLDSFDLAGDPRKELNVDLTLSFRTENRNRLWQRLITEASAQQVPYIANSIRPSEQESELLWQTLRKPSSRDDDLSRLRAAAAQSFWFPTDSRWQDVSTRVAESVLIQGNLYADDWTIVMSGIDEHLFRGLIHQVVDWRFANRDSQVDAALAVSLLRKHASESSGLVEHMESLVKDYDLASRNIDLNNATRQQVETWQSEAQKQANVATVLVALGNLQRITGLLDSKSHEWTRKLLIEQFPLFGVPPKELFDAIDIQKNASVRAALWLSIGGFVSQDVESTDAWLVKAKQDFRSHGDAQVHSATEWLITKMGHQDWLADQRNRMAPVSRYLKDHNWRQGVGGQTLVRIEKPGSFLMSFGRPASILYDFEVGTREVTIQQLLKFAPDLASYFEDKDSLAPATRIPWYLAAEYCNWLSLKQEIPLQHWCYEPVLDSDGKVVTYKAWGDGETILRPQMRLVSGYQQRAGFRMPLENEWEWLAMPACNENLQSRQFKSIVGVYQWCGFSNENEIAVRNGGLKKPDTNGLFDLLGNVAELTSDFHVYIARSKTSRSSGSDNDASEENSKTNEPKLVQYQIEVQPGTLYIEPLEIHSRFQELFENNPDLFPAVLQKGLTVIRNDMSDHRLSGLSKTAQDYLGIRVLRVIHNE